MGGRGGGGGAEEEEAKDWRRREEAEARGTPRRPGFVEAFVVVRMCRNMVGRGRGRKGGGREGRRKKDVGSLPFVPTLPWTGAGRSREGWGYFLRLRAGKKEPTNSGKAEGGGAEFRRPCPVQKEKTSPCYRRDGEMLLSVGEIAAWSSVTEREVDLVHLVSPKSKDVGTVLLVCFSKQR